MYDVVMNVSLNNKLINIVIENEVNSSLPNISQENKEILRKELITRFNLYKSYTKRIPNFWGVYEKYLKSKEWKQLRETVFKRDNYQCVLCGRKANHCHHLSYGFFCKYGDSKRIECVSLCKECHELVHK